MQSLDDFTNLRKVEIAALQGNHGIGEPAEREIASGGRRRAQARQHIALKSLRQEADTEWALIDLRDEVRNIGISGWLKTDILEIEDFFDFELVGIGVGGNLVVRDVVVANRAVIVELG